MHVALGLMQENRRIFIPIFLGGSFALVAVLHIAAAWRERETAQEHDGWLMVGPPDSIPDKKARIVTAPNGQRIAVFRDGVEIGALTNLCAHQNGPLGEGCILNGLVTCPWHGYEYRLVDGCAPPPFTEKLATYRVRLRDGVSRSIRSHCRRARLPPSELPEDFAQARLAGPTARVKARP
jgi:nitrite reductase/ring-hydroxylating ferredoxin subunit